MTEESQKRESQVKILTERHKDELRRVKREHKMEMSRKQMIAKERYTILLDNKKAAESTIHHQYQIKMAREKQKAKNTLDQANDRAAANSVVANKA